MSKINDNVYLNTKVIFRSVRILKWLSLTLSMGEVVYVETIEELVNHSNKLNSFFYFVTSSVLKSIGHCFTENLHMKQCQIILKKDLEKCVLSLMLTYIHKINMYDSHTTYLLEQLDLRSSWKMLLN